MYYVGDVQAIGHFQANYKMCLMMTSARYLRDNKNMLVL